MRELSPLQLCRRCDATKFDFETTADLPEVGQALGLARAVEAIQFGIGMRGAMR
jgi:hypothetical protein